MAKLSLNDMKYIIEEASKMVLNEITVKDAYARFYKGIPEFHYESIISLVQTGGEDFNDDMVLSPESKWALAVYKKNPEQFLEDFYKLRSYGGDGYLDIFKRAKERRIISGVQADLNQYKSIAELGRFINTLDIETILGRTKGEMSNAVNSAAKDIEIPYEDEIWKVVIPKTYEASCYWGQGTEWCTATRSTDKWYDKYSSEGPLFININKQNNRKYQFHFESEQFMDQDDWEIDKPVFDTIKATDGLKDFYKKHADEGYLGLMYESLCDYPKLYVNKDNNKEYVINVKGERITEDFDYIEGFNSSGLSKVRKDDLQNFIDKSGNLILPKWFNKIIYSTSDDYIRAGKDSKYQFLFDRKGRQINKVPLKQIFLNSTLNLIPVLDKNGYANYLDVVSGDLFLTDMNINLEMCLPFQYRRGIIVNTDNKMNIIDREGNILCDEWYDNIQYTHRSITDEFKVFFYVRKNGLHNIMDYQGNIMCKHWFSREIKNWMKIGDKMYADVYINKYNAWDKIDGLGNLVGGNYDDIQENKTNNKMLLTEIKVVDAAKKYYSDIDANDFMEIVTTIQGSNDTLLPETKWALALYKKQSPRFMEDLYKLKNNNGDGYLDIFLRAKERRMISGVQADLNQYKSIAELGRFVGSLDVDAIFGRTKKEMSNAVHEAKDDIEKLYEDDTWIVLIPKTYEASCYWAQGAEWCTATRERRDYYDSYTADGPLYMNINKQKKEYSVQFHFETNSYMDYWDQELEKPVFNNFPMSAKLNEFYKSHLPSKQYMDMLANDLYCNEADRYSYEHKDKGVYMVDENLKPLAGPFIWMEEFQGDVVMGYIGTEYVFMDANGNVKFKCNYPMYHSDKCILYQNKDNVFYLYDVRNNETRKLPYKFVDNCHGTHGEPYFIVKKENGLYNVIYGLDEREIIPEDVSEIKFQYDRLGCYFIIKDEDDRYNVVKDSRFLFNKGFLKIQPMGYVFSYPIFKVLTDNGGEWQYIDVHGKNVLGFNFKHDMPKYNLGGLPTRRLLLPNAEEVEIDADLNIINQTKSMPEGKLTPEDVKFIISETAKKVITEIKVIDAYSAYYKDIPEDIFQQIVTTIQGDNDTLLPVSKWYLGMYKNNPQEAMETLPNLRKEDGRGILDTWERCVQRGVISGQESNLANYKTLMEWATFTLGTASKSNVWGRTKGEWSNAVNAAKNDIEKVYEDENWFVIIPKSMDASCYWGNGTEWCTATRNEENNQFKHYSEQGPLYININKQTGEKYQFHFETHSFMNQKDEGIQKPVMKHIEGVTEGFNNFYREQTEDDSMNQFFMFDYNIDDENDWTWINSIDEAVATVKIEGKGWNFFTDSDGMLSERYFESVHRPDSEIPFAQVYHNGGWDIFNIKEKCLEFPSIAFDSIDSFESYQDLDIYYAKAYKNNKITLIYYLMNNNGYMTWLGRWCDYMDSIDDNPYGYIAIKNDELWAYVNLDGEIVGDYFDGIWDWRNDYCKVENNGKYNFIDEQGNFVSEVWFDECDDYINLQGKVNVEINGETIRFDVNDINEYNEDLWD